MSAIAGSPADELSIAAAYRQLAAGAANRVPLSPLSLLRRSADVYADKTAVVHGERRYRYAELYQRSRRLAGALSARGVGVGDTVAVLAPNTPALLEAHFGVPMTGAVLNALNTRLDAATIGFILGHGAARVLICDRELAPLAAAALDALDAAGRTRPLLLDVADPYAAPGPALAGADDYEDALAAAEPHPPALPDDEWQAIALSYTSGTTGDPKGVVTHHRGAYLNALGNALTMGLNADSVYLWTLPMFHCNGWTYTWAVTAVGGTHVCLRAVDPAKVFALIREHRVSHLCAAPVVLNMLIHAPSEQQCRFQHTVDVATGGAAPPSQVIASMEALGFRVTHLYGLTESYGPSTVCVPQPDWPGLGLNERAARMARQGVRYITLEDAVVADPETLVPVPADGKTLGEILLRGNTVMSGYLKNPDATAVALRGGWYHSGDLAVCHPDGYIEVKDRSKDIIISGGENVSSLEVEEVLYQHPAVVEAAVVAMPDPHWGEVPCAFVARNEAAAAPPDEAALIAWCRERLAKFKVPKRVVFGELPKTSTGKIQKYALRERAARR